MKPLKSITLWISVLIFSFLFIYEPALVRAQSIEGLHGIHEDIGGGNYASADNGGDNYALYVLAGAVVIGVALYFYLKWAEKKRPPINNTQSKIDNEKEENKFAENTNGTKIRVETTKPAMEESIVTP